MNNTNMLERAWQLIYQNVLAIFSIKSGQYHVEYERLHLLCLVCGNCDNQEGVTTGVDMNDIEGAKIILLMNLGRFGKTCVIREE